MNNIDTNNKIKEKSIKCLGHMQANLCCDSVEWCPCETFEHLFVIGHYQLNQSTDSNAQTKSGGISLYEYKPKVGLEGDSPSLTHFNLLRWYSTGAVFDMKWHPKREQTNPLLAVAMANGVIELYQLSKKQRDEDGKESKEEDESNKQTRGSQVELTRISSVKIRTLDESTGNGNEDDSPPSCLSLDWNTHLHDKQAEVDRCRLLSALSDGSLIVLELSNNKLTIVDRWKCHTDQVWTGVFDHDYMNTTHTVVYSASDDGSIVLSDRRTRNDTTLRLKGCHNDLGVCSLNQSLIHGHVLYSGGFDEHLKVWDKRYFKQHITDVNTSNTHSNVNSRELKSYKIGDGVWRIRVKPITFNATKFSLQLDNVNPIASHELLLIAGMRSGFHVLDTAHTRVTDFTLVSTYALHGQYNDLQIDKNEILAYGCDWMFGEEHVVASCSFYDKEIHCWKIQELLK
ncbi:hypothetical protein RFI_14865 [Reticulomyxa filosa]|uniref:Uncharacterized protein n=1 Tax=Reticulomyxa filosa TaxID=46433 RepID=X6N9A5_RETFI|nr:hypothetical protein RFI_14865 [Reticulomyxa filosa]|eukprot:ETO22339.1 hypothetical protein RFI_14865 [Reticulomyxa filosa]